MNFCVPYLRTDRPLKYQQNWHNYKTKMQDHFSDFQNLLFEFEVITTKLPH